MATWFGSEGSRPSSSWCSQAKYRFAGTIEVNIAMQSTLVRALTAWGRGAALLVCVALSVLFSGAAHAAPDARLLRVDPRAAQENGIPILTTVVDVTQSKRISDAAAPCATLTGNAQLDCMSQSLEKPLALYTPFPFPAQAAIFTVTVDDTDVPAKYLSHSQWGESQQQPGVGTAWLVLVDADRRMGKGFDDAKQIAQQFITSLGPNDIINIMFFNDRQIVKDSRWMAASQRARAQQFVQSVQLGLEAAVTLSAEDLRPWRWMKNYRLWEANRKVFLWPENWIEPELRDDKTPFFRDLENQLLHYVQHATFLGAALLFWWPVIGVDPGPWRMPYPARLFYLFLALPQNSFLGVALLSAGTVLYPHYVTNVRGWGPTPLEDQQLGGILMWVAGDIAFLIGMAVVIWAWLRHEERRTARLDERLAAERLARGEEPWTPRVPRGIAAASAPLRASARTPVSRRERSPAAGRLDTGKGPARRYRRRWRT